MSMGVGVEGVLEVSGGISISAGWPSAGCGKVGAVCVGAEAVAIAVLREGKSVGCGFHGFALGGDAGIIGTTGACEAGTGVCLGYFGHLVWPVKWSEEELQVAQNGELKSWLVCGQRVVGVLLPHTRQRGW